MITLIEVGDFLAHSATILEFEPGVTVFVGDNGAGKSSIIDAITFALFGKHTRNTNKGLIRRGADMCFAKVCFSIDDNNEFEAIRKIDSKGTLSAKFTRITDGRRIEVAAGERRQFGESMTEQVEGVIGLDFQKLKVASIVQQGELNAIINAKPREFKELLNAIIRIDKLDVASESMKIVNREFRQRIKKDVGYDDTDIEVLVLSIKRCREEIEESRPQQEQLESQQSKLKEEIRQLRIEVDAEAPKIGMLKQLEQKKREITSYGNQAVQKIRREIDSDERKVRDCQGCFEYASTRGDLESKMERVEQAVEDTAKKMQEMHNQISALKEKQALASKLQLKDNRCPVCDSKVERLNPLFQEEHIQAEIVQLREQLVAKEREKSAYSQKRREFSAKLDRATRAETTLSLHAVGSKEELAEIQEEIKTKRDKMSLMASGSFSDIASMDSHARMLYENISDLETATEGFNEQEFNNLKGLTEQKQNSLSQIDQKIGAMTQKISENEKRIGDFEVAVSELKIVKEYVKGLDDIQKNVFSRDGPVATSLRSWALEAISAKASEYLVLLNTKIQRIMLTEKNRDVSITCHSRDEILELESLSGGEKVSVALALRLGMANLLGASNLNLMILDEPTAHLDAERKKSLVGVLSQLSDIANPETQMQFLIITHDAEIFEDSAVERIYKFESTAQGSKVAML